MVLVTGTAPACSPDGPTPRTAGDAAAEPGDAGAPDSVVASAPIRAVTLDARREPDPGLLDRIRDLGATHLALTSFGFQDAADDPEIRMHTDGGWYSESDRGVRELSRQAVERGMGVILKPHLWVGGDNQSRQDIGFDDDADWRVWTRDYRRFLMHYARLAEAVDADVLVVGTELRHVVRERPGFWRDLVRDVREVYGGRLTYAANWYEEYREVSFWDELDFVGVQAYFPLTDTPDPSIDALRSAWSEHRDALERVHRRTGRPVLFTELGYRNVGYAADEPWKWPRPDDWTESAPAPGLQARLYRAALETMMPQPWFAGSILWKWRPENEGRSGLGFDPPGKPAEDVIRRWYIRDTPELAEPGRTAP